MGKPSAIFFSTSAVELPTELVAWSRSSGVEVATVRTSDDLMARALRARPRFVWFADGLERSRVALQRLKADSYTGIVPAVLCLAQTDDLGEALASGADEVVGPRAPSSEVAARFALMLKRSDRDVNVHPSTRLPGTFEIEADVASRIAAGVGFAMCYADLDHFKEYNDRYSYADGDRVIRLLSRILHDVVKGVCGESGFVGHIGGDDFIFVIPLESVTEVCGEIVQVFDTLIEYQYSEQDRRAGYFFGKDRRGQLHRVPLMTLSIGVVTNERRVFTTAAQVSQLATEMKGYAKTLTGSVYTVDRRADFVGATGQPTPPRPPRAISVVDG